MPEPYKLFSWLWIYNTPKFASIDCFGFLCLLLPTLITIFLIFGLIIYERKTFKSRAKLSSIAIGLILAGTLANFIEQMIFSNNTDFIAILKNNELLLPVFNIAELSFYSGILLFMIYLFKKS